MFPLFRSKRLVSFLHIHPGRELTVPSFGVPTPDSFFFLMFPEDDLPENGQKPRPSYRRWLLGAKGSMAFPPARFLLLPILPMPPRG